MNRPSHMFLAPALLAAASFVPYAHAEHSVTAASPNDRAVPHETFSQRLKDLEGSPLKLAIGVLVVLAVSGKVLKDHVPRYGNDLFDEPRSLRHPELPGPQPD